MSQDVDLWVRELEAAGWRRWEGHMHVWESPSGHLFRGPYKAWTLLHSHPELSDSWATGVTEPRTGEGS